MIYIYSVDKIHSSVAYSFAYKYFYLLECKKGVF